MLSTITEIDFLVLSAPTETRPPLGQLVPGADGQ
jgi:hypothetical protein